MELILCWSQYAMLPSFNSLWIAVSSIFVSILCSLPTMVYEVIVSLLGSLPFPTLSYLILISPEFIWIFLGFVGFCRIFEWKERVWEQVKIWLSPIIHTTEHSSIDEISRGRFAPEPMPDHARFRCVVSANTLPNPLSSKKLAEHESALWQSAPSLFIRKCSGLTWLPPSVTVDKNPTSQCLLFIVIEQNWWNSWRRLPFLLSSVWITNLKHSLWKLTGHSVVYHSRWRLRLLLFLYCISHNGDWTRVSSRREKQAC